MQAFAPNVLLLGPSGGAVEASAAAQLHSAGDAPRRGPRDHATPPRRRPDGRPHGAGDRLSTFSVDLRMVLRIEHLLVGVNLVGLYAAPSRHLSFPLCVNLYTRAPHCVPSPRDCVELGGKRAYRHGFCSSKPTEMVLTRHFDATILSLGAEPLLFPELPSEENVDDEGDEFSLVHAPSHNDVPPCARPFPSEAATPHAHLTSYNVGPLSLFLN
jgi:hypothetical protein